MKKWHKQVLIGLGTFLAAQAVLTVDDAGHIQGVGLAAFIGILGAVAHHFLDQMFPDSDK